jgi:diguanylate cyclase (GGDEF)-like protein/PAS domain S-box-containing protein
MRELDPDEVIPERVSTALDTFSEGLLIVDKDGYIVYSNTAFSNRMAVNGKDLVGKDISELKWKRGGQKVSDHAWPWMSVLSGGKVSPNTQLQLKNAIGELFTFSVNASPISVNGGEVRGAMITFDDITEIEFKNAELTRTLDKLESSQKEITRQNQELQILATRDPLSGALNRRSFFEGFQSLLAESREDGSSICCVMVDIDHFKSVNDRYGHAVGDSAIKWVASILSRHSRPNDLVGRYGGEEFCLVLSGTDLRGGYAIAERIRMAIERGIGDDFPEGLKITSSFGVSGCSECALSHTELLEQADWALYEAKQGGRNRVVTWESATGVVDDNAGKAVVQPAKTGNEKNSESGGLIADESMSPKPTHSLVNEADTAILTVGVPLFSRNSKLQSDFDHSAASEQADHLPNRALLFDRIDQAIKRAARYTSQVAVLSLNIEALQRVTHAMGLNVGEKFARKIVSRVKHVLRNTDTVIVSGRDDLLFSISRLDSNQIVILLTDLKDSEIVTNILQRILSANSEPIDVEGNDLYWDADVGVSMYPFDGEDPDTLITNAMSAAMEASKKTGQGNFQFYAKEINDKFKKRLTLEAELHRAVMHQDFTIFYQPKVSLNTGSIVGMEALIRWQHPQLGMIPPNDFIPLAEQTGLIDKVGSLVIRGVCQQILSWQEAGYGIVPVAVNLSPAQFKNPELAEQILGIAREFDVPVSAIELEITEGVLMKDINSAIDILNKLSDAGLCITLDDFGTGYSSLSYLKKFPLKKVKVDRSFITDFVHDRSEASIVSAIIAMGHSLGLQVVAEGVETEEQLRFLQDLRCDEVQGYLVSKPLSREDALKILEHPSAVRRMVQEYHSSRLEVLDFQQVTPVSGMVGILNDFETSKPDSSAQENIRVFHGR